MKQENINNKVLDDLDKRIDNWNKLEGVPERVDTIETDATALEIRVRENETDISGLETNKQETQVKVAKVEKELNSIKHINSNQEATQAAQGYGVVNLPKIAGEGHADFGIKGLTATNLIENGDFSDGTSGWSTESSNIVVVDGILELNPVQQWGQFSSTAFQINVDNKYYVSAKVKSPTRLHVGWLKIAVEPRTSGSNMWETHSAIYVSSTNSNNGNFGFIDSSTSDFKTSYFDDLSVINLTETFGAGNEPTKEQCDVIFSNYFEGTQSVQGAMRVKSVGKNLFDKSKVKHNIRLSGVGVEESSIGAFVSNYIKVIPNTTYIPNHYYGSWQNRVGFFDKNKNVIKVVNGTYATTPSNCEYIRINGLLSDINSKQIEEGTVTTPYEPYTESISYLNAKQPLRTLPNGVADEIVNGMLIKRVSDLGVALVEPITTPIQTSGSLIAYPSGTVYIEQVVADAGMYTTQMDILNTDLPIKTLDKLSKVDYTTGLERSLDVSKAVITAQSFTHPDLTMGDIVFFEYYYDLESTNGNASVKYYDSRYTVKDSVTNKVYKWSITIANGVPTITTVEV